MKTPEQIAQWAIDHRYAKSEQEKTSDSEMYHTLVEQIKEAADFTTVLQKIVEQVRNSAPSDNQKRILENTINQIIYWINTSSQEPKAGSIQWNDIRKNSPLTKSPGNAYGWYAIAMNPVNWADFEDETTNNSWRAQFGFSKAWYNNDKWWEPDPHGYRSEDVTDRVTHWSELPTVPLLGQPILKGELGIVLAPPARSKSFDVIDSNLLERLYTEYDGYCSNLHEGGFYVEWLNKYEFMKRIKTYDDLEKIHISIGYMGQEQKESTKEPICLLNSVLPQDTEYVPTYYDQELLDTLIMEFKMTKNHFGSGYGTHKNGMLNAGMLISSDNYKGIYFANLRVMFDHLRSAYNLEEWNRIDMIIHWINYNLGKEPKADK